jgi:hypothetical protein
LINCNERCKTTYVSSNSQGSHKFKGSLRVEATC